MKTIIDKGGRIIIPAAYRKALGIEPGNEVLITLEDGELRVVSMREAVARAQTMLRRYIPKGRSLSDELMKARREETARG